MANLSLEQGINKDAEESFAGKSIATRDAYGAALYSLGMKNHRIVALDADLSCSTKTIRFAKAFPERFFNVGISEQDMVCTAGGLALAGLIPFASTFAVFETGRAWEQVRQTIAYSSLNVKLAATHAGITVGEDGASHQALEDIALMRVIPGMTILVPADGYETEQFVFLAAEYDGPVYIRLGRAKAEAVMPSNYRAAIGKGYLFSKGSDVCIIATGMMVSEALKASKMLSEKGISAGVLNISTIKPLDEDAVYQGAQGCRLVATVEEHSIIGGLGGAVAEFLSEHHPMRMIRIGTKDTFGCSGPPSELLKTFRLTAEDISSAITKRLG